MDKRIEPALGNLVGPFTKIARAMSRQWNVTVVPSGSRCATDGDRIYIPFNADYLAPEKRDALNGMLDHEVAHVAEERTHREAGRVACLEMMKSTRDPIVRMVFNAFEDIRIEDKYSEMYPGVAEHIRAANIHALEQLRAKAKDGKSNPWYDLMCAFIYKAKGEDSFPYEFLRPALIPYYETCLDLIGRKMTWSEDAMAVAVETVKRIRDMSDRAEMEENEDGESADAEVVPEGNKPRGKASKDGDKKDKAEEGSDDSADSDDAGSEGADGESGEGADEDGAESDSDAGDDSDGDGSGAGGDSSDPGRGDADEGATEHGDGEEDGGADSGGGGSDGADEGASRPSGSGSDDCEEGDEEEDAEAETEGTATSRNAASPGVGAGKGEKVDFKVEVEDDLMAVVREELEGDAKSDMETNDRYVPDPASLKGDRVRQIKFDSPTEKAKALAFYNQIRAEMSSQISTLRARQIQYVQTISRSRRQIGLNRGRLDANALSRVRLNDQAIFQDEKRALKLDTAILVLVDMSGSMGSNRKRGQGAYYASRTALALTETWQALGVPNAVIGFDNYTPTLRISPEGAAANLCAREEMNIWAIKDFHQKIQTVRENFAAIQGRANNFDADAVRFAAEMLLRRPEKRKILFVISDGQPAVQIMRGNHYLGAMGRGTIPWTSLVDAVKEVSAAGVDVIGIGAGTDAVKSFYNAETGAECAVVRDLDKLAPAIFEIMKARFQKILKGAA